MIKGITLQNFMSYENAYIPLERGLNLICGPNGAGKSSILLAISVVLGQTYTERAKRLSDLIRRGTDQARISLLIDNSPRDGRRPFSQYHTDMVAISRILKKNGDYPYELQGKPVSKTTITEVFTRFGLNPDNLLIIMHQLMVGKFGSINPIEKLQMLEEAVGFQSYRRDVVDAFQRLQKAVGEEESLASVLESTKETYDYWKREYEKYLRKKELESKLRGLQSELLWARIEKRENALLKLKSKIESRKKAIESIDNKFGKARESADKRQAKFEDVRKKILQLDDLRLEVARNETCHSMNSKWARQMVEENRKQMNEVKEKLSQISRLNLKEDTHYEHLAGFFRDRVKRLEEKKSENEKLMEKSSKEMSRAQEELLSLNRQILELNSQLEVELSKLIDARVELEVLSFKKTLLTEELNDLEVQRRIGEEEIAPLIAEAKKFGPGMATVRKIFDIMLNISAIEEQLKPLALVSEDVEKMYSSYTNILHDLKEKADTVTKNRKEILLELNKRLETWREIVNKFLDELNTRYNSILGEVGAKGIVRLAEAKEIEKAGIELLVGFRGSKPTPLDSLTQSGGERSVALMAFLLALQQYMTSPFRAIDEFDVHMDPKNREVISSLIVSSSKKMEGEQYVAITPGQVTPDENVHVIIVQNIDGSSVVSELK